MGLSWEWVRWEGAVRGQTLLPCHSHLSVPSVQVSHGHCCGGVALGSLLISLLLLGSVLPPSPCVPRCPRWLCPEPPQGPLWAWQLLGSPDRRQELLKDTLQVQVSECPLCGTLPFRPSHLQSCETKPVANSQFLLFSARAGVS